MAGRNRNHLAVIGPNEAHYGYGKMHKSFVDALPANVSIDPAAETVVFMLQPQMVKGWFEGQHKVLMTMWETDKLPQKMAELLPAFDTVVVPCEHNRVLFAQHHPNVVVVPLGVDINIWFPRKTKRRPGPFRFLAGGSHWKRKGLDVVLAAFSQLEGNVELHLKCKPDIIGGVPPISDPRVIIHREVMTEGQERDLYWDSDCFISMSRGEGWGLMPLQAIAAGIPTIISDTSGHRMFQHLAYSTVGTTSTPCTEDKFYDGGNWDEPNLDELVAAMQKAATTKPKVQTIDKFEFTWQNSALELLKVAPAGKKLPNPVWVSSDTVTVPVKALRKIQADIGVHRIRMDKDEIQHISVNAKNVLLDAGAIMLV